MRASVVFAVALLWGASLASGQIAETFSYQGILTDTHGHPVPDGDYSLRFKLYETATGGTALWTETKILAVEDGLFSTNLGDVTPFGLPFDRTYWLEITPAGEPAMTPRVQLTAAPYAIRALYAEAGDDGDWGISGEDVYHVHGQVAVGTLPAPAPRQGEGEGEGGGERSSSTAKLYVVGSDTGIYSYLGELNNAADGRSAVFGLRQNAISNDGTGYSIGHCNSALAGYNATSDAYSFGVTGHSVLDHQFSGGVFGGQSTGDPWGALGFRDGAGQLYGVYTPNNTYTGGAATIGGTATVGGFKMSTGATNGYVLTSNAVGTGTWQPAPAGFSLPYSGATSSSGTAFAVENTGTGPALAAVGNGLYAASFYSDYSDPSTHVVHSEVTGTGAYHAKAVYGRSTPSENFGIGGLFVGGYEGVKGVAIANVANSETYTGIHGSVAGIYGTNCGVRGTVVSGDGTNHGVFGSVVAAGENYGVYGMASSGVENWAGYFYGNVHVQNVLSKGAGSFRIDHPLDPENKYLQHSFVESPDMMNVYNGNVLLDESGEAWITMPEWFDALNRDFRYQLTAVGGPGPNLHVAKEMSGNRFKIAGGEAGLKVSWQVTGIRQDKFAEANRIAVEVDKRPEQRGRYLNPELFGRPASEGLHYPPANPKEQP